MALNANAGSSYSTSNVIYGYPHYFILKWNVINVSGAKNLMKSPCFDVKQTSKWHLVFDPEVRVDDDDVLLIGIYLRNQNYSDIMTCRLKGELTVYGSSTSLVYKKEFRKELRSESGKDIEFYLEKSRLLASVEKYNDFCQIRCEVIISPELKMSHPWSRHLLKLSSDILQIFEYRINTDVSVYGKDGNSRAHKGVLCARSTVLAEMLESFSNWVHCEGGSALIHTVLIFMYSADPQYLIERYPVDTFGEIFAMAKKLRLKELKKIFLPVRIQWDTLVEYEQFLYDWEIKNISKLEESGNSWIQCYEFRTNEESDTKWKLIFDKQAGVSDEDSSYGLHLIKANTNNIAHDVQMQFVIHNVETKKSMTKSTHTIFKKSGKSGFARFVDKKTLYEDYLTDDTLNIKCKLKILEDPDSRAKFHATSVDCSDNSHTLRLLSELSSDLKGLLESKRQTDIELVVGTERLEAHKVVLWARSPYFTKTVPFGCTEYVIKSVDAATMKHVLLYMYSAELPTLDLKNMTKLYRACALFALLELQHECRRYIQGNLKHICVLDILMMAHEHRDAVLEKCAIVFASTPLHAKTFIDTCKWLNFCSSHNVLAMLIYDNLTRALLP